jgi:hypothetical protein
MLQMLDNQAMSQMFTITQLLPPDLALQKPGRIKKLFESESEDRRQESNMI